MLLMFDICYASEYSSASCCWCGAISINKQYVPNGHRMGVKKTTFVTKSERDQRRCGNGFRSFNGKRKRTAIE